MNFLIGSFLSWRYFLMKYFTCIDNIGSQYKVSFRNSSFHLLPAPRQLWKIALLVYGLVNYHCGQRAFEDTVSRVSVQLFFSWWQSYCVAQAGLTSSCLNLLKAVIAGICHRAWQLLDIHKRIVTPRKILHFGSRFQGKSETSKEWEGGWLVQETDSPGFLYSHTGQRCVGRKLNLCLDGLNRSGERSQSGILFCFCYWLIIVSNWNYGELLQLTTANVQI